MRYSFFLSHNPNRLVLRGRLDWQGKALSLMSGTFSVKQLLRLLWGGFVVVTGGAHDNRLLQYPRVMAILRDNTDDVGTENVFWYFDISLFFEKKRKSNACLNSFLLDP